MTVHKKIPKRHVHHSENTLRIISIYEYLQHRVLNDIGGVANLPDFDFYMFKI